MIFPALGSGMQISMRDMKFPIDVLWVYRGKVVHKATLPPCAPHAPCRPEGPQRAIDYVIEVPGGSMSRVPLESAVRGLEG